MATLLHQFRDRAGSDPGSPVLYGTTHAGWGRLSWGAWWAGVLQAATGMRELGVRPGQRVAVWSSVGPAWAVALPAIRLTGAIPALVPGDVIGKELERALGGTSTVVVDDGERLESVLKIRESTKLGLEQVVTLARLPLIGPRIVHLERMMDDAAHLPPMGIDSDLHGGDTAVEVWGEQGWSPVAFDDLESRALTGIGPSSVLWLSGSDDAGRILASLLLLSQHDEACVWFAQDGADFASRLDRLEPTHVVLSSGGWTRLRRRLVPELEPSVSGSIRSWWHGRRRARRLQRARCYFSGVGGFDSTPFGGRSLSDS